MDKIDIIHRIGQIRIKANLSARALSQRIELNDGYINRLESKKDFLPSMEVLLKIIEVCNSTQTEFFYYDIEAYRQDLPIIELLRCAEREKKNAIFALLKK